MEGITHIMVKPSYQTLSLLTLFFSLAGISSAQINMQQMPGLSVGTTSGAALNRNLSDSPVVIPAADLKAVPEDFVKLKLAPGFLMQIAVLDDSDFNGSFRIDEDGDIALPVIGVVHVAGATAGEARNRIRQRLLAAQILKDPQVILTVSEYTTRGVTIIGEVTSPGKYPLLVPRKLVDVLAMAGGPTLLAGNEVQIVHGSADREPTVVHYSRASSPATVQDVFVQPGDTVQVKRAGIVYVLGAVNRPGGYVMQEEGTLNILQAIALANGTSVLAATGKIYILRRNPDGSEVDMAIDYKQINEGKRSNVQLRPTDILFVPTSRAKWILVNTQSVLSSAASAGIYAATLQ